MQKKSTHSGSEDADQGGKIPLAEEGSSPGDARILIAGNEHRFNESLQKLLAVHGYESHIALTTEEASAVLDQHHFEVIILDLKMVEIGGLRVMDQIKGRQRQSKLIMLSNDSLFDKAVWALRQGADDFFRTPFSPEELVCSIDKMLTPKAVAERNYRKRDQLLNSEVLHRFIVNNSPDFIYLLNQDGQFSFFNRQLEKLLGFSREELLGKHYSTLILPEDLEKSRYVFSERRTGQRAAKNVELRLQQKKNGSTQVTDKQSYVDVELNAIGVYRDRKKSKGKIFLGTYGVVRDISERKALEKQLQHQLYHDELTDLPNRSLFQERLRLALCQVRRYNHSLAVMFLDIDGFKEINDSFGHAFGDMLLQRFSVRLKSCLREGDTLARMSGDEFTILIPQITSCEDTKKIAQKIINKLNVPFKLKRREILIGVSIGIAVSPGDSDSDEELIQKADLAMYYVKHHGKNGFAHCENSEFRPGCDFPHDKQGELKAALKN